MKQFVSRLKTISAMLIWDTITAIVLFGFMFLVLNEWDTLTTKALVVIATVLFVVVMLIMKYQLLYKQYGRDNVTGGKNKKNLNGLPKIF